MGNHAALIEGLGLSLGVVYFLVPPIVMLISMIIQVVYLKRSLHGDDDEASSLRSDSARHVSITVLCVSILFFVCSTAYIGSIAAFYFFYFSYHHGIKHLPDNEVVDLGVGLGFTEFTMPLIYAALYPVILICRKEELRRRYVEHWRRIYVWCRPDGDGEETAGLT